MSQEKNSRRKFLRNISIGALAATTLPKHILASSVKKRSNAISCNPLTLDYYGQGPFYTPNAPTIQNNQLANENEPGTRLILSGHVKTLDCDKILPNTIIDIWHADDSGAYDNAGFHLRGVTQSNAQGFYLFETILPGKYLNGSKYRPRHIHLKITAPGEQPIVTQIYFDGDTDIEGDAAASVNSGTYDATHRIIALTENNEGKMEGTFDIVIDGNGVSNLEGIHVDKGMIYQVSPNPFSDVISIQYGVFQDAMVSLDIFNMQGQLVATLDKSTHQKGKHEVTWQCQENMPNGMYWISIKVNDVQTHYQKVVKR